MKIIDKTPLLDEKGELGFVQRVQGMLQFGFNWPKELEAQKAIIAYFGRQLEKGYTLIRNMPLGESGIIVDVCGEHGLWFDDDELSRVIAWMRTGGLEAARRDVARLKSSPDAQRKRRVREAETTAPPAARSAASNVFVQRGRNGIVSEIRFVVDALANVFDWPRDRRTWPK